MAEDTCFEPLDTAPSGHGLAALLGGFRWAAPTLNAATYSLSAHDHPAWLEGALGRVGEMRRLATNWDSYGATQVLPQVIAAAAEILRELTQRRTPLPAIVPTADGSVQLEWHTRGIDLEVRWISPSRIRVYLDDARGQLTPIDEELQYDVTPLRGALRELSTRAA